MKNKDIESFVFKLFAIGLLVILIYSICYYETKLQNCNDGNNKSCEGIYGITACIYGVQIDRCENNLPMIIGNYYLFNGITYDLIWESEFELKLKRYKNRSYMETEEELEVLEDEVEGWKNKLKVVEDEDKEGHYPDPVSEATYEAGKKEMKKAQVYTKDGYLNVEKSSDNMIELINKQLDEMEKEKKNEGK